MKHIILSIILLFSFTGCNLPPTVWLLIDLTAPELNDREQSKLPIIKPREVMRKTEVLVYEKTISLPVFLIRHLQFSPTNPDELAVFLTNTHYALIDLKNGTLKKDIKFDEDKDFYSKEFSYSDDGKKLYINRVYERVPHIDTIKFKDTEKFVIFDLSTGKLSPYYEYGCNNLIPKEYQNSNKIKSGCFEKSPFPYAKIYLQDLDKNSLMTIGYQYQEKSTDVKLITFMQGIVLYDKDSLKAKEIIHLENNFNTIMAMSLDKQYVLFRSGQPYTGFGKKRDVSFKVYDLKNRKTIHILGDLFPSSSYSDEQYLFVSNNNIAFYHTTKNALSNYKKENYISIVDLSTKEKKRFEFTKWEPDWFSFKKEGESFKFTEWKHDWFSLNSRYILWKDNKIKSIGKSGAIDIFDTKEMKIVQRFTYQRLQYPYIAVSQKHKKVAFANENEIYLYNIVEEGE